MTDYMTVTADTPITTAARRVARHSQTMHQGYHLTVDAEGRVTGEPATAVATPREQLRITGPLTQREAQDLLDAHAVALDVSNGPAPTYTDLETGEEGQLDAWSTYWGARQEYADRLQLARAEEAW